MSQADRKKTRRGNPGGRAKQTMTIEQAIEAMGVDGNTLRQWLDKAGVPRLVDPANNRRRLVAVTDLRAVAAAHGRALLKKGEVRLSVDEQIAELRQRIEALEKERR